MLSYKAVGIKIVNRTRWTETNGGIFSSRSGPTMDYTVVDDDEKLGDLRVFPQISVGIPHSHFTSSVGFYRHSFLERTLKTLRRSW